MISGAGAVGGGRRRGDLPRRHRVRNMGSGIAVLHGWYLTSIRRAAASSTSPLEDFHRLTRDLYIARERARVLAGRLP